MFLSANSPRAKRTLRVDAGAKEKEQKDLANALMARHNAATTDEIAALEAKWAKEDIERLQKRNELRRSQGHEGFAYDALAYSY